MNDRRYQWILYIIVAVIGITIGIQIFWNYKNFKQNKAQVINDIQQCLDNAVDTYYTNLAKENYLAIVADENLENTPFFKTKQKRDSSKHDINITSIEINSTKEKSSENIDSIFAKITESFDKKLDTIDFKKFTKINGDGTTLTYSKSGNVEWGKQFKGKKATDSLKLIDNLKTIFISFQSDSLDYKIIDSLLQNQFSQKHLAIKYNLKHLQNNELIFNKDSLTKYPLKTQTNSNYLKPEEDIQLSYNNPLSETFIRSITGILISTLLILAVISCLFYLLKIIKHQKQLAEVKNDLISNITHEFKTPIATIGVALESISNFNAIEDKEKTKNYVNMSSHQLEKLNLMVEKLLETATLDSNNLELNTEIIDVVTLLNDLSRRYKIQFPKKEFNHSLKVEHLEAKVDSFHFENALNNILDNAVKYGGNIISIDLIPKEKSFEILISDNGNTISKANKERIFEKFYRVPKGNTHDVKGFGIGLYYTKSIIEKHGGSIEINLSEDLTTFKITVPNG